MTKSLPGKIAALKEPTAQTAARMIEREPYYEPVGGEIALFEAAYASQMPVLLKGPTGCGKTRFMEHMAWRLKRPLITVSCHDDLTAADLVGRYLITSNETVWVDGPLARAVRMRRHLLSRRNRRSAQGHDGGDPPARRRPPHAADGKARRTAARAAGVPARDVLQPRLPERAEGTETEHAPALCRDRIRLSRRRAREKKSSSPKPASTPTRPSSWSARRR